MEASSIGELLTFMCDPSPAVFTLSDSYYGEVTGWTVEVLCCG